MLILLYVCIIANTHLAIIYIIGTGYWKTDHNVTLGQLHFIAQLIATLMHYPCTIALLD